MQTTLKTSITLLSMGMMAISLAACGSDTEKTTVIHDRPTVVQTAPANGMTSDQIESSCKHGYDNSTHSCY